MASNRIGALIGQLPELQAISRRTARALALQAALKDALPANLAAATSITVSNSGELLFFADNGAVAAKLKQLAPRVRALLRQRGTEVTGVRIQVQVGLRHNPLHRKRISISETAGITVLALARRLGNSPLGQALERLGQRGRGS
jgi:hypothetical protein